MVNSETLIGVGPKRLLRAERAPAGNETETCAAITEITRDKPVKTGTRWYPSKKEKNKKQKS